MRDDDYYDALADEQQKRRPRGCQCFSPGEVAGTCPGPDRCLMCDDGEEDEEAA